MRSASADDLSARARIRDTAIGLFGRMGFARTTVRMVAGEAGVSPGLVIHHFGSKEGLRLACDEFVIADSAERSIEKADPSRVGAQIRDYLANPDQYADEIAYIRESLRDQSEAGDNFYDAVVAQTRDMIEAGIAAGTVRDFEDVDTAAVVMASNSLAILVLGRHIARALGTSVLGPDMLTRLTIPTMDIYTHGFFKDTSHLDAAKSAFTETEQQ
ncbi:TetR/AcrR family transcriptional regulator [Arthrobacter sp. M4]|uniref:TetR/AcrR family transcriptional regulator n=1 Tax=Arthrobacter sp. M4 TaxID=218160 RepID=UPI001CDC3D67|nr:TetR family transcriptional regulator [Arthrobacter sp. M4]MCA4132930.1 TetR family transcriptional regulator [Arthrobacter sp. M4]